MKQKIYWRITVIAAVLLILLTFTPIVMPAGKIEPKLFSMPYTLWMSMLITIILVVLTYFGGRIYLKDEE
jgi:uncharacterized membrane protein